MGTNYYLRYPACKCCGYQPPDLHIGKSSGGWCFSLCVYPVLGINNLDDWALRWVNGEGTIVDEYEHTLTCDAMLQVITDRGPHNQKHHTIGDGLCVGHGVGSWDFMIGDFS